MNPRVQVKKRREGREILRKKKVSAQEDLLKKGGKKVIRKLKERSVRQK